jgi:hypothetical protein
LQLRFQRRALLFLPPNHRLTLGRAHIDLPLHLQRHRSLLILQPLALFAQRDLLSP